MLDGSEYTDRLNALQHNLRALIRSVAKGAGVDDVHDMRTALRRLQVTVGLLPRGKRRAAYLEALRDLSRASRELRDLDVIALRLDSYPRKSLGGVHSRLSIRREEKVERFRQQLKEYTAKDMTYKPGRQRAAKVGGAHERAVRKAEKKLAELLPSISGEAVEMEHLHEFRKTGRKLRYLLELSGEKGRIGKLIEIQDRLGELRDIDLTLEYLLRCGATDALKEVADRERERRSFLLRDVGTAAAEASAAEQQKG